MHRLGISVYPEKSTQKEVYDYSFTCLLSVVKRVWREHDCAPEMRDDELQLIKRKYSRILLI